MELMRIKDLPVTTELAAVAAVCALLALAASAWRILAASRQGSVSAAIPEVSGIIGLALLITGQYAGLFAAPREAMMGEVGRILYVHVPSAWLTMVTFTFTCAFAFFFLMTGKPWLDRLVEATAEVGVVLALLLQLTGMLFAKPTWGMYWDWDPRLVSTAAMMLSFIGVLVLRAQLDDPERRATWTSVASILATISMLVTYFSVQWWRSIHQMQSSPSTVASPMVLVLRINAFAFLFLTVWMVATRARIAATRAADEAPPPLPAEVTL